MEIFDHFRDFFLLTFNVHLACYVLPFAIKYRYVVLSGRPVALLLHPVRRLTILSR